MHASTIYVTVFVFLLMTFDGDYAKAGSDQNTMSQIQAMLDKRHHWKYLGQWAKESYNAGHDSEAYAFAKELEQLTPKYTQDDFYGDAVQDYNVVLGRLALKAGDIDTAKHRLLAATNSTGSPTLHTFGPNTALAKDLLLQGETNVVLEYFERCRKFWRMDAGTLDQWRRDVQEGRIPDFGGNLVY